MKTSGLLVGCTFRRVLVLSALMSMLQVSVPPVKAATLTVTNLADSGPGTLREAIVSAQSGDTIEFSVQGTIALSGGVLAISNNLQILGPGSGQLMIDAQHLSPVFLVSSNATVILADLTVTNGQGNQALEGFAHPIGGGVQNFGTLTMARCVVAGCEAGFGVGGGIFNMNTLTLRQCSLFGNDAEVGGGIGDMGNSLLLVDSCAVFGNFASGPGGGGPAGIAKTSGSLSITNSTISGNAADAGPGGVGGGAKTVIESCTIAFNQSSFTAGGIAGPIFECRNTIISNNRALDLLNGFDVEGTLVSDGYNLIGDTNGCTITGNTTGNIYGKDPLLGPLQDNGGPTFTHALSNGSPAIDAGSPSDFPPTDQRGLSRPQDGDGDKVAITDIGAYEAHGPGPITLLVTSLADSGPGTLREAISLAQSGDTIDIVVQGELVLSYGRFVNGGDLIIDKNLLIIGPGSDNLKIIELGDSSAFTVRTNIVATIVGVSISGKHIAAIWNYGDLSLSNCVLTNCVAFEDTVGGIRSAGNLSLTKCTVSHCSSSGSGGIGCSGSLTLRQCTIADNVGDFFGGGIVAGNARVTIDSCTISGNFTGETGGGLGGGVYLYQSTLLITNSTISGNKAGGFFEGASGGGIYALDSDLRFESCTIVSNNVFNNSEFSPPTPDVGGGIFFSNSPNSTAVFESRNSIFAWNTSSETPFTHPLSVASDCSGIMRSLGYNLIQDTNACTIAGDSSGNVYNRDPIIGLLQDNGGPTLTHALLPGSPAIDAGSPTDFPPSDQRSFPRPQDGNGDGIAITDIGAYEAHGPGAVTFKVTSLADAGPGTLREAISFAQSGDTIVFNVQGTIILASRSSYYSALSVDKNIQIKGPGADKLTIQVPEFASFTVFSISSNSVVSMADLTITGGYGGIINSGTLSLTNCDIVNCGRDDQSVIVGGISSTGDLSLTKCIVAHCSSGVSGGIACSGSLTLHECTITDNFGGFWGGGIGAAYASVKIDKCTISGNQVAEEYGPPGGGIFVGWGTLLITNSTISGNFSGGHSEPGKGGGIYALDSDLQLESCTVVSNFAYYGLHDVPLPDVGAGIYFFSSPQSNVVLGCKNSILAGNLSTVAPPINPVPVSSDCTGIMLSGGNNLIQDTNTCTITGNTTGNIYFTDPLIGPLQDNGGPTLTHALLTGSPAIDAGSPSGFPPIDQRGVPRPQGPRDDIGAYEKTVSGGLVVTTLADSGPGSLRAAILSAQSGDTITFAVQGTIVLKTGVLAISNDVQILGPGSSNLVIDAQLTSPIFLVGSNATVSIADLTITNGSGSEALPGFAHPIGGGVQNFGNLTMTRCVIGDCQAIDGEGGGIANVNALKLEQCFLFSNEAVVGGAIGDLGSGPLIIDRSTLFRNFAAGAAGGVGAGIFKTAGIMRITNSTISGNLSDFGPAGIEISADSIVESSTIVSNVCQFNPAGVFILPGSSFEARDTIIADNFAEGLHGGDVKGTLISGGYNLIKDTNGAAIIGDTTGNIYNTDPLLGPLQNNGGPTLTHALLDGSPAINAASPFDFPPIDQRGFIRPADGTGDSVFLPDIGAYEKQPSTAVVTTLSDSGPGSLRNALGTAIPGATISFAVPGTIFLTSGPLVIDRNVTLVGPCEQLLTIDAQGTSAGLTVASGVEASISDITISNAINTARPPEGNGGGIRNFGTLTLTRVAVLRNSATGFGGGIYNNGKLTLRQCLVSSNSATFGGGIGDDGFNRLTVDSTTISFNNAISPEETSGGGIYKLHDVALLTDSTISKNGTDEGNGGGIATFCYMRFESCTIVSNRAFALRFPVLGKGGGIYVGAGGFVDIHNTMLAGNAATGAGPDCFGTLFSQGYNLIQNTSGCTIAGVLIGNLTGVDPQLGPLEDNGGPTPTHALLAGSPAIDAGSPYDFPPTDQRGVARPQDGNGDGIAITDIGAYEKETVIPGTIPGNIVVTSLADSGPGTLRDALSQASSGSKITFAVQGTILVLNTSLDITQNVQIAGPGIDKILVTGHSPVFVVSNGATATLSDLTISNVFNAGPVTGPGGGAIRNFGNLTLTRVVIADCSLEFGMGGAIYSTGDLALHQCSLSNNVTEYGGAIADVGTGRLIIDRTTVNDNLALHGGDFEGLGGGILKFAGLMWMSNSTVSANEVRIGDGGGLSTGSSYVFMDGCTIVSNRATSFLDQFGRGGGIYKLDTGTIRIKNTILAGNSASFGPDCFGWLYSEGWNLIQNPANCTLAGVLTGNIIGADPRLGPLDENGGPTLTHALLNGSPAIDTGSPYSFQPIDQRGVSRPQDGNGDGIAIADIGAYEKETPMPPCIAKVDSIDVQSEVSIVASGVPGELYTVQYTDSLSSPKWITLPAVAASQTGLLQFIETRDQSSQSRFYRVIRVVTP